MFVISTLKLYQQDYINEGEYIRYFSTEIIRYFITNRVSSKAVAAMMMNVATFLPFRDHLKKFHFSNLLEQAFLMKN